MACATICRVEHVLSPPVVRCRFCRSSDGHLVLDLGHQPSCELFPCGGDPGSDELYPLRMWLCADCGLAQLADDAVVPEEPLGHEPAAVTAQRAEAVVVTLDTTVLGWRPQDLNLASLPFSQGIGIAQYTSDPRFREIVRERLAAKSEAGAASDDVKVTLGAIRSLLSISREHPGSLRANLRSPEPRAAVETFLDIYSNPGLSWATLATIRERTTLPVLFKGILHPDDAVRAVEAGAHGLVVSNHGGRQVDGAVASLDALPGIRAAVGPDLPLVLDSGVRTGSDVAKALALGADAVALGRPYIYGLALAGTDGVREVVENVVAELDLTLALCGVPSARGLGPEVLTTTP